jgi:hypothetical protein
MNSKSKHLLKWNILLWLTAMVMPVALSFAFAATKFPWQIIVPFLLFGPMLGSNRMLMLATDASSPAAGG